MVKITVCIGSSCHLKGSRQVIDQLQFLINEYNVDAEVTLGGAFCMGKCQENGVNIAVDGQSFSLLPKDIESFFKKEILSKFDK